VSFVAFALVGKSLVPIVHRIVQATFVVPELLVDEKWVVGK